MHHYRQLIKMAIIVVALPLISMSSSCISDLRTLPAPQPESERREMIRSIHYEENPKYVAGGYTMVVDRRVDPKLAGKFVLNNGVIVITATGKQGRQRIRASVDYADIFSIKENSIIGDTISGMDGMLTKIVASAMKEIGEGESWSYAVHTNASMHVVDGVQVKILGATSEEEQPWERYDPQRHDRSDRKAQQFTKVSVLLDPDGKGLSQRRTSYAKSRAGAEITEVRPVPGSSEYVVVSGYRYDVRGTKLGDTATQSSSGISWFGVGEMTSVMNRPATEGSFKF